MSNYYYDGSHKCYRKKHKKCDCDCHCEPRYQTYTSGPLFRNADTDFIQVSALNQTDEPQTVTIAVQNYQDTCDGDVYPSYGYLCGELINDDDNGNGNGGSDVTTRNGGCIYCEPEGVTPFVGPVTFTIPPRQLFSIRVFAPQEPTIPQEPIYVVRVTKPVDPIRPTDPTLPTDPLSPVTINTWGISFAGVIQQGNTVLNGQFTPGDPFRPTDPV
ncbi:sodium:proton exchanger [Bacillus paranthracis]|uniref:sodium:proton exchanger n=1 Tax=Bacillus paranthracis TaxID=2026186 RepID=UPI0009173AB9|nr:sodium:proton exchanger [Bacillus paranthracis]OJE21346.1 sodium:proton exchanger [Bacillus paranthracis]